MIITTYFCAVCQLPFRGRKGTGGRMVCGECMPYFDGQKITRKSAAAAKDRFAQARFEATR